MSITAQCVCFLRRIPDSKLADHAGVRMGHRKEPCGSRSQHFTRSLGAPPHPSRLGMHKTRPAGASCLTRCDAADLDSVDEVIRICAQVPALSIFETNLRRGKFDESRKLSNGSLMEFAKIYPMDAVYDHPEDVPEDVRLAPCVLPNPADQRPATIKLDAVLAGQWKSCHDHWCKMRLSRTFCMLRCCWCKEQCLLRAVCRGDRRCAPTSGMRPPRRSR